MLIDNVDGDLVPTAGIPWFAVPFGRDSLITSMQCLPLRPSIAAGTLRFLARHQGQEVNDFRDEQPGKILHEVRLGELAKLHRVPHSPYYGSVDATPLFLVALGEYVRWTGDLDLARTLLPNAEAALGWMRDYGDIDGDGFIEYQQPFVEGIRNQGWKDSVDSASHRDGRVGRAADCAGRSPGVRVRRAPRDGRAVRPPRRPGQSARRTQPGRADAATVPRSAGRG